MDWLRPALRPNLWGIPELVLIDLLAEIERRQAAAMAAEDEAWQHYVAAELVIRELMTVQ